VNAARGSFVKSFGFCQAAKSTLNGRITVVLSIVAMPTSVSGRRKTDLDDPRRSRQENAATIQPRPSQTPRLPVKPLSRSQQMVVWRFVTVPRGGGSTIDPVSGLLFVQEGRVDHAAPF
jgi:hypothetical protein